MPSSEAADQAALYRVLSAALQSADALDLTMAAIHIDEARAAIAALPGVAALVAEHERQPGG